MFQITNFGLALGMALEFYTRVAQGLKLKVRTFCGLTHAFVEITREKLVGGSFLGLKLLKYREKWIYVQ